MNLRRTAGLFILLVGAMLSPGYGWAGSWQQTVTARVSTEFDTNPAMSATTSEGVWRGLFEPGYVLIGMVGENEIRTGLAVQMARASNKKLSPDRDSPSVFLNWLRQSETGGFDISSRYTEISTREADGIDATGLVPASSTRVSRTFAGKWNKEMSELSTVTLDGSYDRVSYQGGTYVNYSTQTVGLTFSRAWDEHITPYIRVSGNKYVPAGEGRPSSRRNDASLGLDWKAEYLVWSMQAGQSRVVGGNASTQGSIETKYTGQLNQLGLKASRQVVPSGLGGFVKADQLSGNWSYALSEYSRTGLDLVWQKNLTSENSSTSTTSGLWLEHNFNALWKLRSHYQHRTSDAAGSESVSSDIFGLSFAYAYSDF